MKQIVMSIDLSEDELQAMVGRYHFNDTDFFLMEHIYYALQPLLLCKLIYETVDKHDINLINDKSVIIVVTLGKYVDQLQNLYSEAGRVFEAYLVECLCMGILEKAYQRAAEEIYQDTGFYSKEFFFPDVEATGEMGENGLKEIIDLLSQKGMTDVIYNESMMLLPKKSVVFKAVLCENKDAKQHSVCEQCENVNCQNRETKKQMKSENSKNAKDTQHENSEKENVKLQEYHYGYQQIFGKKKD